jgi:hypothetical protein
MSSRLTRRSLLTGAAVLASHKAFARDPNTHWPEAWEAFHLLGDRAMGMSPIPLQLPLPPMPAVTPTRPLVRAIRVSALRRSPVSADED